MSDTHLPAGSAATDEAASRTGEANGAGSRPANVPWRLLIDSHAVSVPSFFAPTLTLA